MVAFSWIMVDSESEMLTQNAIKRVKDISHATSKLIANDVLVDDYASACDALKAIAKDPDVTKVVLANKGYSVLTIISNHEEVKEEYGRIEYNVTAPFYNNVKEKTLTAISNIDQAGDKKLILTLSTQSVEDLKQRVIVNTLYLVLPFWLGGLIIIFFGFRPILRDIKKLSSFARHLPSAKGASAPHVNASLELEDLSNALTAASHTIYQQSALLRQHNEELEDKVAKQTEKAIVQERLYMQQSRLAAMGEMISSIAHQWRQPLNGIAIMVQDLELARGFNEIGDDYLPTFEKKVMTQVRYLSETIDDFRNFFRVDREKVSFNILKQIEDACSLVGPQLETNNITIESLGDESLVIVGYPNEFKQVVLNLINNAKDVLIERKISAGRIELKIYSTHECTVIECSDNGGGISSENIDKIFDPYFTTKGPERGTGIGLYMSKTIIENHMQGELVVQNNDKGATFVIKLPHQS